MTKDLEQTRVEWINLIKAENEKIKNTPVIYEKYGYVVVSRDFIYAVVQERNMKAGVRVIGGVDKAVRLNKYSAKRIAETFHAENGYGKIEWQVMPAQEYQDKLIESNNKVIELLTKD